MKTNSIRNEPSLRPYTTRSAIFIHPIRISKYIQYITIWRRRTLQRTCVHASFPPFLTGNNARAHTPKAAAHAHLNVPIQKYTSLKSSARQAFDAYSSAISARGSTDMCPSSAPLTDSPFSPCHSRNAAHSFRWVFFFRLRRRRFSTFFWCSHLLFFGSLIFSRRSRVVASRVGRLFKPEKSLVPLGRMYYTYVLFFAGSILFSILCVSNFVVSLCKRIGLILYKEKSNLNF